MSTGRESERASEQSKGASEACEVRSDTRELWGGASCPPPHFVPLVAPPSIRRFFYPPYSGRYFYPQAPPTNRWVISVSIGYWFSIQRILASYPKLFLCFDPGEYCHLSFPFPTHARVLHPIQYPAVPRVLYLGTFPLALKLPTLKHRPGGNVNDTFPCWSLWWATVNQHPPPHHPSIHWMPVISQVWMNLTLVNIWLYLSNQFCRK